MVAGTGFPGKWSQHQAYQTSRSVWMALLGLWFNLGSQVRSRELDLMILTSPFQLEIIYDSMILNLGSHATHIKAYYFFKGCM